MRVFEHLQNVVGLQEDLLSVRHRLKEIQIKVKEAQNKKEQYKALQKYVVYICVCVCCAHMCVCVYKCVYVHVCVSVFVCVYVCL